MNFTTGKELLNICNTDGIKISEAMLLRETEISGLSRKEILNGLSVSWEIMKSSAKKAVKHAVPSMGGLIGGEASKLYKRFVDKKNISGNLLGKAIIYSMGVMEVNASMGLIVAAPTAGSSGVIPGLFTAMYEEYNLSDELMFRALLNAGAVGYLVMRNASVAGAEGGCQAEIGTACAMAASGISELMDGTPEMSLNAAAIAFANILGLVCDPVGGLVESPCQTRNAMGVSNALVSAELTLAGIKNIIPFDEMVQVVYSVGKGLPFELRESALGGIAAAASAKKYSQNKIY